MNFQIQIPPGGIVEPGALDHFCDALMESPPEEKRRIEQERWVRSDEILANIPIEGESVNTQQQYFDFNRKYEVPNGENYTFTHPNSPDKWVERNVVKRYYIDYTPTEEQKAYMQQYYNQRRYNQGNGYYSPQQQFMINNAAQYIRNRGPWSMNYIVNRAGPIAHPNQQRSRKWVNEFANSMEKELNDPVKLAMSDTKEEEKSIAEKCVGDGFVPAKEGMFKSKAEVDDNNYYRLKGNMEKINEYQMSEHDRLNTLSSASKKPTVRKKLSADEALARKNIRMSKSTPSINPKFLDYNFVGKSGEGYWSLAKAQEQLKQNSQNTMTTAEERSYARAAALKGYNTACKVGSDLALNPLDDSEEGEEYERAGYEQYMRNRFGYVPQFTGSYYGGYGFTDENGLPTRWFNDGGRCFIPTKRDFERGNVVNMTVVFKEVDETASNNFDDDFESSKDENDIDVNIQVVFYTEDEESIKHIESIYDTKKKRTLTTEEMEEEIKKNNDDKDYNDALYAKKNNIKTEKEQYLSDDSYLVAKELSRYNEHLANVLLWYREKATERDYDIFLNKCRDQLILYRNEDPFASIKNGVIHAGSKLINVNPKPTHEEEIKRLTTEEEKRAERFCNSLIESGMSPAEAKKIAYKELNILAKCKTIDDKILALRSLRNMCVIPKEKDMAMKIVDKIYSSITTTQKLNISNYEFFKKIKQGFYPKEKLADPNDRFDGKFDEWWNLPTKTTEYDEDFDDRYSKRMIDLNQRRLDYIASHPGRTDYLYNEHARRYNQYINETCRDKDGNSLSLFEKMNNMIARDRESAVMLANMRGEGIYKIIRPPIISNYHEYAMNMLRSPSYLNQGMPPGIFGNNNSMLPIYNQPGAYENKQQTFIKAMFHKRKMGSVM